MPLFSNQPSQSTATWEPQAADSRLAQTAGANSAGRLYLGPVGL